MPPPIFDGMSENEAPMKGWGNEKGPSDVKESALN